MAPKKKSSRKSRDVPAKRPLATRLWTRWAEIPLACLLCFGFGLRMIDLTDPPLDFHPTRQFRGALVARSIYYQIAPSPDPYVHHLAVSTGRTVSDLEPPIIESIVAFAYLLSGGEHLWDSTILYYLP